MVGMDRLETFKGVSNIFQRILDWSDRILIGLLCEPPTSLVYEPTEVKFLHYR